MTTTTPTMFFFPMSLIITFMDSPSRSQNMLSTCSLGENYAKSSWTILNISRLPHETNVKDISRLPRGINVSQDILRFPHETNVLVPSSDHMRHARMKSTFRPTSPHRTLRGECLMMLPQTSTPYGAMSMLSSVTFLIS
jgi:hypothetical protein